MKLLITAVLALSLTQTSDAQIFRRFRTCTNCNTNQQSSTRSISNVPAEPVPVSTNTQPQVDVDSLVARIVEILARDQRFQQPPPLIPIPVDYARIRQMIESAIPEAPVPVLDKSIVHFTIIADQRSDYWRRLAGVVSNARERYHRIILAPPPPQNAPPIGPLPQVVEYRNSIPQRTYFARDVYDVLDRIARGTYPNTQTVGDDMALDPAIEGLMQQVTLGHHERSMNLIGVIDKNLTQVGGIINEQAVAQTILSSDDATIFAGLNTASRIPRSGALAD